MKQRSTELEEHLKRCETENISLQTQLFNIQTDAQKFVCCNKIFTEQEESYEQENLKAHKEFCTVKSNKTMTEYMTKKEYIIKFEKSNSCIIDPVCKLLCCV